MFQFLTLIPIIMQACSFIINFSKIYYENLRLFMKSVFAIFKLVENSNFLLFPM